jgi:hypothetical protein
VSPGRSLIGWGLGATGMDNLAEEIKRYRSKAEDIAATAAQWSNPDTREALLKIAREYDGIADCLERLAVRDAVVTITNDEPASAKVVALFAAE